MAIISAPGTAPQANQLPVLAAHTLERLHAEGVRTLSDWKKLGRKRREIFGVPPRTVALLDEAAKAVRRSPERAA